MELLKALMSVRLNFRRMYQVLYKAPGFLHGTYMLQQRGRITEADLIRHALLMRYGDADNMLACDPHIEIQIIEIR